MTHGILICKTCRKRISGCRCMDHNTIVEGGPCYECVDKAKNPAAGAGEGLREAARAACEVWAEWQASTEATLSEAMIRRLNGRMNELRALAASPAPTWTREKPTEGGHYHLREHGKNGRTIVFLSDDGDETVTFYNGRREFLGNINPRSEWSGPIPTPEGKA